MEFKCADSEESAGPGQEDLPGRRSKRGRERESSRKKKHQKEKEVKSAKKKRKRSKSPSEEPSEDDKSGAQSASESEASGPAKGGKRAKAKEKKKGPPRKKGGRRAAKGGVAAGKQEGGKWQKCTSCKKTLDKSKDFHADQTKCKACSADMRAFNRATEAQGCSEKIQDLAKSDPGTHTRVVKEWVKERRKMQAAGERIKFNIWQFVISLQHSEGERLEARGRMMWRSYFLTWSQSDEGGNLSEQEAKKQWQEYESDKSVARDYRGPGGHIRLKVPMFDDVVEFKQLSRNRELSKSEKLNSKSMLENKGRAAGLRLKMLVGGGGSAADNMGDQQSWDAIRQKMTTVQMDGELAMQPQAEDLVVDVQQKSKRRLSGASAASRAEESGSASGSSEYSEQEESKDPRG